MRPLQGNGRDARALPAAPSVWIGRGAGLRRAPGPQARSAPRTAPPAGTRASSQRSARPGPLPAPQSRPPAPGTRHPGLPGSRPPALGVRGSAGTCPARARSRANGVGACRRRRAGRGRPLGPWSPESRRWRGCGRGWPCRGCQRAGAALLRLQRRPARARASGVFLVNLSPGHLLLGAGHALHAAGMPGACDGATAASCWPTGGDSRGPVLASSLRGFSIAFALLSAPALPLGRHHRCAPCPAWRGRWLCSALPRSRCCRWPVATTSASTLSPCRCSCCSGPAPRWLASQPWPSP